MCAPEDYVQQYDVQTSAVQPLWLQPATRQSPSASDTARQILRAQATTRLRPRVLIGK